MKNAHRTSHHPRFVVSSAAYQTVRDAFGIENRLEGERLNFFEDETSAAYIGGFARVFKKFVAKSKTSKGDTQQKLADELHIDRSVLSVAVNHGELGGDPLATMLADPEVQNSLLQNGRLLSQRCGQAGMIAAAQTAAGLCDLMLTPPKLGIDLYEKICDAAGKWDDSGEEVPPGLTETERDWAKVLVYTFATVEGIGCEKLWYEDK